jgi:hypothetical protein
MGNAVNNPVSPDFGNLWRDLLTIDRQGAIAVFEGVGFRGEALMRDPVKGDGRKHDIVLLSHDVVRSHAQMEMYGVADVF